MGSARTAMADPVAGTARVAIIAPTALGATALAVLRARGIDARIADAASVTTTSANANAAPSAITNDDVLAWALTSLPTAAAAVELGATCARAAAQGRPVCLLAPSPEPAGRSQRSSRAAIERAAALSYLRANGAALGHDVDAWLESIVLLVRHGLPRGPRAAIVAPAGSWLEAQALAVVADADKLDTRVPVIGPFADGETEVTDVVLYDPAVGGPPPSMPALYVPVAARGELAADSTMLHGARAALGAVAILGRAAERIAQGLGAAPHADTAALEIDKDRLQRQVTWLDAQRERLGTRVTRLSDHETKVFLAAYGVEITRQAVAQTPSAAVKVARKVGYPVELKPFGADVPSELAGCPVERATTDALVRQAFTSVLAAASKPVEGGSVIVREVPPMGREVSVTVLELPALGWTVVLEAPGVGQLAAPAPLRPLDAHALAVAVVSSRAGDAEPDRVKLANLLRRASHLAVDLAARLSKLELPRVVVGGRGARTLVVDAAAELR